jgi:hypothetical protein
VHRFARDLLVTASAATVGTAVLLIVGRVVVQPPSRPTERLIGEEQGCLDAPVTALSASGIQGQGRLCVGSDGVHSWLWVRRLSVGHVYSAWLGYADRPPTGLNPIADLRSDDPVGMPRRIGSGVAPSTRELEFHGEFHDLRISRPAHVTIMLLSYEGLDSPHGQVIFVLP